MDPRTTGGLPTLLESTLLTVRPTNEERMRHDLTTLAAPLLVAALVARSAASTC